MVRRNSLIAELARRARFRSPQCYLTLSEHHPITPLEDPTMKTVVILLVILPCCSLGQGLYIGANQGATSLQATYSSTQSSVSTQGIEIGHSLGGIVDVGLQVGRARLDSYYNTLIYGLSTSLYLINPQSPDGAILSIGAAYRRLDMRFSTYQYNGYENIGDRDDQYKFGGTVGTRVQVSPIVTVLYLFTLGVGNTSDELHSETGAFYAFGLSWIIRTGNLTQFVVTPSVSIGNDVGTFGLKGGLVLLQ